MAEIEKLVNKTLNLLHQTSQDSTSDCSLIKIFALMEVWQYCCALIFILTECHYHFFIKALVKFQYVSVKFI